MPVKIVDPGTFRHLASIQTRSVTQNEQKGFKPPTYAERDTRSCAIGWMNGREIFRKGQMVGRADVKLTMRAITLSPTDRIVITTTQDRTFSVDVVWIDEDTALGQYVTVQGKVVLQ